MNNGFTANRDSISLEALPGLRQPCAVQGIEVFQDDGAFAVHPKPEVLHVDEAIIDDNSVCITTANCGGKGVNPNAFSNITSPVEEFHKYYFSHVIISKYLFVSKTAFSKLTPETSSSVSSPEFSGLRTAALKTTS